MKLSIIIPMYNTESYTRELLECLEKQIEKFKTEVEIIVIDNSTDKISESFGTDYSIKYIQADKQCGVSKARNVGLDMACGEYIAFIDSDDMISDKYIDTVLKKIYSSTFDYCFMSWKWFGAINDEVIITDVCPSWNWSIWNRIWRQDFIGNVRFNEKRNCAEDAEFIMKTIGSNTYSNKIKGNIIDILYLYRVGRTDNLSSLLGNGQLKEFKE